MMDGSPITLVAKLLAIMLGVELADILAPHLVILVAGAAGSIIGVMDWRKSTRFDAWMYVVGFTLLAWLFAGSAAWGVAHLWGLENSRLLLAPCAVAIGWVGHRWPRVGEWAAGLLRSALERRAQ
jgi:small basic protein